MGMLYTLGGDLSREKLPGRGAFGVGQLIMLAEEGGGAEGRGDGSGDGQADQVIGAGGGIGLLGRFLLFGGADDDDGAGGGGLGVATAYAHTICIKLVGEYPVMYLALTVNRVILAACLAITQYYLANNIPSMVFFIFYSMALAAPRSVVIIIKYCNTLFPMLVCNPFMLASCASGFIVATVLANIAFKSVISYSRISTYTSTSMHFFITGS